MLFPVFAQADDSVTYQQERLMLTDSAGDEILWSLFYDTCETGFKKCMLRQNVPPQATQLRTPRFARENPILENVLAREVDNRRVRPSFEVEATVKNLQRIMRQEATLGRKARLGKIHSWAPNFAWYKLGVSKLIMALGTASGSRFMYVGQEVALIKWIRKQSDNSVKIEDLFRQSYRLNSGNVYLTLLTIENVLSDATFEENRENTAVNQKLTDLYAASPNKFGDWYHFFGTMLAGYVGEPADLIADLYGVYRKISRGEQAEKATIAADKAGAEIGIKLRRFVFEHDENIQKQLRADMEKREIMCRASLGNLKHFGPDGEMYIGTRF